MFSRKDSFLLVALASLAVYPLLLLFRNVDTNTLTSWRWVFRFSSPKLLFFVHVASLGAAYLLSRSPLPERHPRISLAAISSTVALLFWSAPEAIIDASRYFTEAKHLAIYGIGPFLQGWGRSFPVWTDLPLIPFLYGLIFKVFGEKREYVQLFTTGLFTAAVLTTFSMGKLLWNTRTGFFGGLLLLGIPYLYSQVPLMLTDTATMAFVLAAVYLVMRSLQDGGASLALLAGCTVSLALLTKYSAWPMLSTTLVVAVAVACRREGARKALARATKIALVSGALLSLFLLAYRDVVADQLGLLAGYQWPGLRRWEESYASTFLFQTHPLLSLLAAFSIYPALRKRDVTFLVIGWLPILVILMGVKRIRYMMPAFPMLALMASYGLQTLRDEQVRRYAAYAIVAFSVSVATCSYLPLLKHLSAMNLKSAGEYLNTLDVQRVDVYPLPLRQGSAINPAITVPLLDIYTFRPLHYRYEKPTPPEDVLRSPFRFTWEYENPEYYSTSTRHPDRSAALVIISGSADAPLPPLLEEKTRNYRLEKSFALTGVFRSKTTTRIYLPRDGHEHY